jgi:uncharacterized protein (TIGR02246 family)
MRLGFLPLSVALFLFAPLLPAQNAPGSDEEAIRLVVARYVEARDQRNGQAIAALFTADADQQVSSGEWRKGRDEVVKGTLASSDASGGKRTIAVESVRFVSSDVAVADGRYDIAASAGAQSRRMWTTLVMVRTGAGWRIAAIRNMLPAPAAAAPR